MRYCLIILFLLFSLNGETFKPFEEIQQIKDMINTAKESHLDITGWEITYKDELKKKDIKKIKTFFKQNKNVKRNVEREKTTYSLVEHKQNNDLKIHYYLILSKQSPKRATLVVKVFSDKNLLTSLENYKNFLHPVVAQNLSLKVNKYTCITARNNDIIKKINLADEIIEKFELQYTEIYKDNLRKNTEIIEIYGYNKEWNETLVISDRPMNVHIVLLHKTKEVKEVIIGTPILIHEY